jgi:hypothetical protein
MKLPNNILNPFFSYGLFRPGEIGFQIILPFVELPLTEKKTIEGSLKLRDGLLIYDETGKDTVSGYKLYFKSGMESLAYEAINLLEPEKYYAWNKPQTKYYSEFNILVGRKINKGIDEERGNNDPIIWDNLFDSIWSDPFIINGFNLLDEYSKKKIQISSLYKDFKWQEESCFNEYLSYQMFYIFLCSILERVMFLNGGFGVNPSKQLNLFSRDPTLKKTFNLLLKSTDFPQFKKSFNRILFRSDDPSNSSKWNFCPSEEVNVSEAMTYYYGLRSNITHRGKSGIEKLSTLEKSFKELLYILRTFWSEKQKESQIIKEQIELLIEIKNE